MTRKDLNFPVLKGIEIDAESDFTSVKNINLEHFDIVLIEYISSMRILKKYVSYLTNYFNNSDYKTPIIALAHPNIHLNRSINILKTEFIPILMKNDIYFECNTHYPYYFENATERMKILISNGVKFTIGSDAHNSHRIGDVKKVYEFLEGLNGLNNVIDLKKWIK
jgi:histidinol phosphatase-like PHP family hydrolase